MPSLSVRTSINIDAAPSSVWEVLTDFPRYRDWASRMSIEGSPEVGTKLIVRMGTNGSPRMTFRPRVLIATPDTELRWLGRLGFGGIADGEHFFVLTAHQDGTTRLHHGEDYSGLLVALARGSDNHADGYEAFNRELKAHVEGLAHRTGPTPTTQAAAKPRAK